MFPFATDLSKSWVTNRWRVLRWYYTNRLGLRQFRPLDVSILPPSTSQTYHLNWITFDDARESLRMFSTSNPWLQYDLPASVNTVVDLGANIGLSSLYWAIKYPQAKVYSVEMVAGNVARCRSVLQINGVQCEVVHAAVAATDGMLQYQEHFSHTRCHLNEFDERPKPDGESTSVRSLSMKSLLKELKLEHVDLLKVDIEGAESYLLQTIDQWAHLVHHLLMEMHHNIIYEEAVKKLRDAGFSIVSEDRNLRTEVYCRRG
jgi:FkbM family methyltransferase